MRQLRQLSGLLDSMPVPVQILVGLLLVAYTLVAVYGRFNLAFGAKVFSKIPPDEIRANTGHIIQYTVIPAIVTVGYLVLLFAKYSS